MAINYKWKNYLIRLKIVFKDKTRPEKYRRCYNPSGVYGNEVSYKFPEIIKHNNPNIVSVKYHHA